MSILVLLEQRGELGNRSLETISEANKVAIKAGKDLYVLYIGKTLSSQLEKLRGFGIKMVFVYDDEALEYYSNDCYVPIVKELAEDLKAEVIVGAASVLGKELCASAAARLGVEMVQECIDMDWNNGLIVKKPIFAGKIISTIKVCDFPAFVSLRPNVVEIHKQDDLLPDVEKREVRHPGS